MCGLQCVCEIKLLFSCHSSTTVEDSVCKSAHTGFSGGLQTSDTAHVCLVSRVTASKTDLEPILQL